MNGIHEVTGSIPVSSTNFLTSREKVVPPKLLRSSLVKAGSPQPLPQTLQLFFQRAGQAISKLFEELS